MPHIDFERTIGIVRALAARSSPLWSSRGQDIFLGGRRIRADVRLIDVIDYTDIQRDLLK